MPRDGKIFPIMPGRWRNAFGWLGRRQEMEAFDIAYNEGEAADFSDVEDRLGEYEDRKFTWELTKELYERGKAPWPVIPTFRQQAGDCVAAGLRGAILARSILEVACEHQTEVVKDIYVPFIYAVSRNQIGGGVWGDGSTGVWGAKAVNKYGVLFNDDPRVPPYYDARRRKYKCTSDLWGRKRNAVYAPEYGKHFGEASDNKIQCVLVRSVMDMIRLLKAGRTLTIASTQGYGYSEVAAGHLVMRPKGSWSHQWHFTDFMDDPFPAFFRMNQWGPNAHGDNLNGEPQGGAWNLVEDVEKELRHGAVVYAYWDFDGDPEPLPIDEEI